MDAVAVVTVVVACAATAWCYVTAAPELSSVIRDLRNQRNGRLRRVPEPQTSAPGANPDGEDPEPA